MTLNSIPFDRAAGLISFSKWLNSTGVTSVTGWRWEKRGWIKTLNLAGRRYVSREAIAEFEKRAAAGEFAQSHRFPSKQTTQN